MRPTYPFFTNATPYCIPEAREYPIAAAFPDSGTPTTISASTGASSARNFPAMILESYTLIPSSLLSILAKYIYSKTHLACLSASIHIDSSDLISPPDVIVTTSPGFTSRMNTAPTVSRAQLSEARMYVLPDLPMHSGLNPYGSLTPMSFLGEATTSEYAPFIFPAAEITASSAVAALTLSLAIWYAIISVSIVV